MIGRTARPQGLQISDDDGAHGYARPPARQSQERGVDQLQSSRLGVEVRKASPAR